MGSRINILLGAYSHLPNGLGDDEFEALYETSIKPLISTLYKFPRINMVFHYSGSLLSKIERSHPELFMLIEDLLARKQAELLGGGFYEPMMPLVPSADKMGQIEMLTTYLRKQFGKRPQGCWVPAMTWEQTLAGPLNSCGMSYIFLEDSYFAAAGAKAGKNGLFAPCITEDQGKILTVFPVSSLLGGEFAKMKPFPILEKLRETQDKGADSLAAAFPVLAPDGRGEIEYYRFFEELSNSDPCFDFTTPGKVHKNLKGLGKFYFPCTPWDAGGACPGLQPRQVLVSSSAANNLYAKMIYVRNSINQLRGDKVRKRIALEELWKAQDASLFNPRFLERSPVRKAAYRALLEAEKITREKGKYAASCQVFDFDFDGSGEYLLQDEKLNCYVRARGAGAFELDYLPRAWNYLDVYGPAAGNSRGFPRQAFTDFIAPPDAEAGFDHIPGARLCGEENWEAQEADRVRRILSFRLPAKEGVPFGAVEMAKTWQTKKNAVLVRYTLKNTGAGAQPFAFIPRLDLSFHGEDETCLSILALLNGEKQTVQAGGAVIPGVTGLEFKDKKNEAVITLESNRGFNARIFHAKDGKPGTYQFTSILPALPVALESGKSWDCDFTLKINS
jgi:hypothetical protein